MSSTPDSSIHMIALLNCLAVLGYNVIAGVAVVRLDSRSVRLDFVE